jgi:hypothetical protein
VGYVDCEAVRRQKTSGFRHSLGTASGPVQANHSRESPSID